MKISKVSVIFPLILIGIIITSFHFGKSEKGIKDPMAQELKNAGATLSGKLSEPFVLISPKANFLIEDAELLLTKTVWMLEELRYNQVDEYQRGGHYYYKRGVTENIGNYDNEHISFKKNGSGYYQVGDEISPMVWEFLNKEKTTIRFTITYSADNKLTVNWENVVLTPTSLKYSEYYTTQTGINSIASGTRVNSLPKVECFGDEVL